MSISVGIVPGERVEVHDCVLLSADWMIVVTSLKAGGVSMLSRGCEME